MEVDDARLRAFVEAMLSLPWVASNVPTNQQTIALMVKMVHDFTLSGDKDAGWSIVMDERFQ